MTAVVPETVRVEAKLPEIVRVEAALLAIPVPPYAVPRTEPFQVPAVIVPTVAISVPTSFAAVMDPANMALVTLRAPMAVAKLPVPVPVTSPVRVIVWSPVLVPERFEPATVPEAVIFPDRSRMNLLTPEAGGHQDVLIPRFH